MAMAMGIVLTKKYVNAIAQSGTTICVPGLGFTVPPSRQYTWPPACTVRTRMAMLNSVRYSGLGAFAFSDDWLQTPAAPTSMVACGPRRISAAISTTYDTDMFDPLAIGNCTLNADVSDDSRISRISGSSGVNAANGRQAQNTSAPSVMIDRMYQRPRAGRSRSKALPVYRPCHRAPAARGEARLLTRSNRCFIHVFETA